MCTFDFAFPKWVKDTMLETEREACMRSYHLNAPMLLGWRLRSCCLSCDTLPCRQTGCLLPDPADATGLVLSWCCHNLSFLPFRMKASLQKSITDSYVLMLCICFLIKFNCEYTEHKIYHLIVFKYFFGCFFCVCGTFIRNWKTCWLIFMKTVLKMWTS